MKRSYGAGLAAIEVLFLLGLAIPVAAQVASRDRSDPHLLAILRADRDLSAECAGCIRAVTWRDQTYARITVDPTRWRMLGKEAQRRFAARALRDVEAVYLSEWGAPDLYNEVFIVDQQGRRLAIHPAAPSRTL